MRESEQELLEFEELLEIEEELAKQPEPAINWTTEIIGWSKEIQRQPVGDSLEEFNQAN
jgi:hypothetical protein